MRTNFYNNYVTEETLVCMAECGGYRQQPICLYDFTIKCLSPELLNFSTRHMSYEGFDAYIDTGYMDKSHAKSIELRQSSETRSTMIA